MLVARQHTMHVSFGYESSSYRSSSSSLAGAIQWHHRQQQQQQKDDSEGDDYYGDSSAATTTKTSALAAAVQQLAAQAVSVKRHQPQFATSEIDGCDSSSEEQEDAEPAQQQSSYHGQLYRQLHKVSPSSSSAPIAMKKSRSHISALDTTVQQQYDLPISRSKSVDTLAVLVAPAQQQQTQKHRADIEVICKRLAVLSRDIDRGVRHLEAALERIQQCGNFCNPTMDDALALALAFTSSASTASSQQQQQQQPRSLFNSLTKIIAAENSVLNRIEDVLMVVERELRIFVPLETAPLSPSHAPLAAPLRSGRLKSPSLAPIPLSWNYQTQRFNRDGPEIHQLLRVNDHIDRICETSDLILRLRPMLLQCCNGGRSNDDLLLDDYSSCSDDEVAEAPAIEKIHRKLQALFSKYENFVLDLHQVLEL